MRNAIGGYFELELPNRGCFLHYDGVHLNSGRNALEYILMSMSDVRHLWIPYYTCDVILEPLQKLNITYSFYHINSRLELNENIRLIKGDYLLYTNYFGIMDNYVQSLAMNYGSRLIVDNTQAWFAEPLMGISSFYSPRKFLGIPDGGIAYCPNSVDINQFKQDRSFHRCSHLLKRIDLGAESGYDNFKENSETLCYQPIRLMSKLTKALLSSVDFEKVRRKRITNFVKLYNALGEINLFDVPKPSFFACPMVYPFFANDTSLRLRLIENKVFVATYWPNVKEWTMEGMLERELMQYLIPIPCDQRYGEVEMNFIIKIVKNEKGV